ncbi:MAG TPA: MBL fold metallo-hydrolase [Gemmatimonadaceae bacterium]
MKLWMLGSGSSGNAVLCECDDERILIDCGFGTRTIAKRLKSIGIAPESISACLVTHEHSDHVSGVAKAAKKWGWTIRASRGTAMDPQLAETTTIPIEAGETIALARMQVEVVSTPHDATESLGFVVTGISSGVRAAIFSDIGHASAAIRRACKDVELLVIESNHDDEMLRYGPYSWWLQERIRGSRGHLSNRHAAELIGDSVHHGLQHVVLAHLSEQCNTPRVAIDTTAPVLRRTRFKGRLTASAQDRVVGPFVPRGMKPTQFELF